MLIDPVNKAPLHEIVYEKLKTSILEGDLRPGEKLNQGALAEQLGVSRMPVRDALRMLDNESLIEYHVNKGYIVSDFPKEKMDDIQFVRSILESKAVELAGEHFTDKSINALETILDESWEALKNMDWKLIRKLNVDFHFTIYNLAPSQMLNDLINKLWHSFPKYVLHEQHETNHHSLQDHSNIIENIKNGNFAAAAELMRKHISNH